MKLDPKSVRFALELLGTIFLASCGVLAKYYPDQAEV